MCCQPLLKGNKIAQTPEQLMRSRYSAFAVGDEAYIFATMRGRALKQAKRSNAQHQALQWIGLEVIDAPLSQGEEGFVEFKAQYQSLQHSGYLHERSRFIKKQGRWYYVDGVTLDYPPDEALLPNLVP